MTLAVALASILALAFALGVTLWLKEEAERRRHNE